jgi:hypothetical protein
MRQSNLVLHCGASQATHEQVEAVVTPGRTDSWVPIPHHRVLTGIANALTRSGMKIVTEAHGLTREGKRYFGLLQVGQDGAADGDFGLVVGVRNSHDKSFPCELALGASVFCCDNLSFSGTVRLARKHTAHIERDLPQLVDRAISLLGDLSHTQEKRFAAYKAKEIGTDAEVHDFLVRAVDSRVLPITRLTEVLKNWREPPHPEFKERTAWSLFNAFSESWKERGRNLHELPKVSQALHGMMDSFCGLAMMPRVGYKETVGDGELVIAQSA